VITSPRQDLHEWAEKMRAMLVAPTPLKDRNGRFTEGDEIHNDGITSLVVFYKESLGVVHRSNARYANTLRALRVPLGRCKQCRADHPLHEVLRDTEYGEVHVHRRAIYRQYINTNALMARDGWRCQLCRLPIDPRLSGRHKWAKSVDHIVPKARGGGDEASNLQAAHLQCNRVKGTRDIVRLRFK
jgi:5-methylcytosine-specific restriction endonuclease McrA